VVCNFYAGPNREVAERILKQHGGKLTPEQRAYLLETIRMGLEAERYIKEVEKRGKLTLNKFAVLKCLGCQGLSVPAVWIVL